MGHYQAFRMLLTSQIYNNDIKWYKYCNIICFVCIASNNIKRRFKHRIAVQRLEYFFIYILCYSIFFSCRVDIFVCFKLSTSINADCKPPYGIQTIISLLTNKLNVKNIFFILNKWPNSGLNIYNPVQNSSFFYFSFINIFPTAFSSFYDNIGNSLLTP